MRLSVSLMVGLLTICFLSSCQSENANAQSSTSDTEPLATSLAKTTIPQAVVAQVQTQMAETGHLPLRRRTNGILRARRQVILKMPVGGPLVIAPREGQFVARNDTLFQLDVREAQLALDAAIANYNEADWKYQDMIRRLKNAAESDTLTDIQTKNILIQSGLPTSEVARREAAFRLQQRTLLAPFNGYLADMKVQAADQINAGQELATLIDLSSLEAEFKLLEQELGSIDENTRCRISWPSARGEQSTTARIDILNPTVEEGGLLRARAKLGKLPRKARLYPGMNVTVVLENQSPKGVIVPKSALVLRADRPVVFVYNPETERTEWRYVEILAENDESYALSDGVKAGEQVITSGALTLDHDIPVDAQ